MKTLKSFAIVVVLLLITLFIYSHKADYYSWMANRYFQRNNIANAQKYFEKAFQNGVNDTKSQDIYINSIINSPLTINAQEKLLNFINLYPNSAAATKAEYFLYDIKQEIYRKYPHNYITQAAYNQKIVRWASMPVTYSFDNLENIPKYYSDEIENAFSQWEIASGHKFLFEKINKNPNIIIKFINNDQKYEENKKYVVAYTAPQINNNTLEHMTIVFNTKNFEGKEYSANQIYNTALHEIAHALGFMGHSFDKDDLMYMTKDSECIALDQKDNLTIADVETMLLLYKIKPDITNSQDANGLYIPFVIMGSDNYVNKEKLREAKHYVRKAPTIPNGYVDIAETYFLQKDYENAIKYLKKGLKVSDNDTVRGMIYYNLALIYFSDHNYSMAEKYIQKAMLINESEDLHLLLAQIYTQKNKTNQAISEYKTLIGKNPHNIEYVIGLANIYVNNKKYLSARKVLKNYIQNNPDDKNNTRLNPYGIIKAFL